MPARILIAGDHFVRPSIFVDALEAELDGPIETAELTLPWPIEPFGPVAEVDEASGGEDEMIAALAGAEICVTQMAPLTAKVLDACPDLRLYAVSRGGPVNANVEAATRHRVAVTFAPGRNATATAEHTLALMLAAVRQIPARHAELLDGAWRSDYYEYDKVGPELEDATVGLVGYGAIGARVTRMLLGFGARVIVFDPYVDASTLPTGVERVETLAELLPRAKVLTLHARLTPETAGLIGAREIAAMPEGSIVVNAARGGLLDYSAVAAALTGGHLYGAGFDVFDTEPLPSDHPLRSAPGVVMTPHLAGASKETAVKAARIVAADVARYVRGEQPLHLANPEAALGRP